MDDKEPLVPSREADDEAWLFPIDGEWNPFLSSVDVGWEDVNEKLRVGVSLRGVVLPVAVLSVAVFLYEDEVSCQGRGLKPWLL